jgi:hypothetical protein
MHCRCYSMCLLGGGVQRPLVKVCVFPFELCTNELIDCGHCFEHLARCCSRHLGGGFWLVVGCGAWHVDGPASPLLVRGIPVCS